MTDILSLPTSPGFSESRFGLVSNTRSFRSPLSGQVQTVEQPGARWQAEYRLPPMKRAQMAEWQSFLVRLRGGAGRFYGFDPDARVPRGSGLSDPALTRNEIRNGDARGAAAGVLPTYWGFSTGDGLTREITGGGVEAGMSYVEVRFSGTPTVNYAALNFESATQIAASEGEVWTASYFYKLVAGSMSNISTLAVRLAQHQASGVVITSPTGTVTAPDSQWRRASFTRTISDTTPDSARLRPALFLALTIGQPIDMTLRVGNAQLEKAAAASRYIPTQSAARSRGPGACVDGSSQNGSQLKSWNWQPSSAAVLKKGDYIAFETARGRCLHMLVADASSDVDGRATLQIEPPLRTSPPDGTPLILQTASCPMALVEDSVSWQGDAAGTYRLGFSAEERF